MTLRRRFACLLLPWVSLFVPVIAQPFAWEPTAGPFGGTITALAINARDDIFAGTESGIFRSTNNGDIWQGVNNGLPVASVRSIAISPSNHVFAATDSGVFSSTDNGDNWLRHWDSLAGPLAVDSSGIIYAGKYRSEDDGVTWKRMAGPLNGTVIAFATNERGELFAAVRYYSGVYKSTDHGDSWTQLEIVQGGIDLVTVATGPDGKVYVGGFGIRGSNDYGATWPVGHSPTSNAYVYCVAINREGVVFGGTLGPVSNDYIGGVIRTRNSGRAWTHHYNGLNNTTVRALAINSHGDVFAGTEHGGSRQANRRRNVMMISS